jgi:alpha-D-ribose 1-methylphosphonate 5-triphosphate synthase subunit PhnH
MLQPIPAGFARPVFESQSTFRVILEAMSRPGRAVKIPVQAGGPPAWPGSLSALVLTLCDMDTPLWLDASANTPEALRFLRFHCGCPVVAEPARADFAVMLGAQDMICLEEFALGSAEYPEKSCTVLLYSPLIGQGGEALRIHGPGVEGESQMPRSWLPNNFVEQWLVNGGLFPRGVDVILVGNDAIVGLPRTLKLEARPCM